MATQEAGGTPNVDSVPDGDSAGIGTINGDTDSGGPSLADMEAIMAAEGQVDNAAGYQIASSKTVKPGDNVDTALSPPRVEENPADAPGAGEVSPAAATEQRSDAVEPRPEVEPKTDDAPAPPAIDVAKEAARLRQGFARLTRDREALVAKTAEANQAIERAKSFEAAASAFQSVPAELKADPVAFLAKHGVGIGEFLTRVPLDYIASNDAEVTQFLDRVVETEKPPHVREAEAARREVERLRKEIADKELAATQQIEREKAERVAREKQESEQRMLADWQRNNIEAARSEPEKYDLINSLNMEQAVHETCVAYFNQYKVILDPKTAADYVEKGLRDGLSKSKYAKSLGQSAPATQQAAKPAAQAAQPSNGTNAQKRPGLTTLAGVASGGGAPSERSLPADDDDRFAAVYREMEAANELPSTFQRI